MATRPFGLSGKVPSDTPPLDTDAPPDTSTPQLGDPIPGTDEQTISSELAKGAGLDGLEAGDKFTVEITGTVTANDPEAGLKFTVDSASNGEMNDGGDQPGGDEDDTSSGETDKFQQPKTSVEMGPSKGMLSAMRNR